MLRTSDLEYDLPQGRIATCPAQPRDTARLMVVDRSTGTVEHRVVRDLPDLLRAGDLLVTNTSRVLPARFLGVREDSGGRVEGLYLRDADPGPGGRTRWVALVKARRFRPGARIRLLGRDDRATDLGVTLVQPAEDGAGWVLDVDGPDTPGVLDRVGLPPIPPYIRGARRHAASNGTPATSATDDASYQTVYAGALVPCGDATELGSVAAPTAGLHFTRELLDRLGAAGVERANVLLHVGPGTFKPVESEFVEQHPMHAEWCSMPSPTREAIARTRAAAGRVVCVGTTSARAVEAFAAEPDPGAWVRTRLLITPGYAWRRTDALLTNFHLPRSTLMALVAAMLPGGVQQLRSLYALAIAQGYRFYSYGDAMLVL